MGKQDLAEAIEREIQSEQEITADELDVEPECAYCGREMAYERYNEHSPKSDYVIHTVPGNNHEPPQKLAYCGATCFVEEMSELTAVTVE